MFEIDTYKVQLVKEGSAEYAHIYADCPENAGEIIATTKRLVEAGKLMDIPVLDHVIVNVVTSDCTSLKEEGFVR